MHRAGRLRHRLTFIERIGYPPQWQDVRTVWGSLEPPRGVQRTQLREIGQMTLRQPLAYLIHLRREASPTMGALIRFQDNDRIRYFSVDTVSDQSELGVDFIVTAREFVGLPARYIPASAAHDGDQRHDGEPYVCRVQVVHYTKRENFPARPQDVSIDLEFLQAELKWPFAQRGDQVEVQGVNHLIDGISAGGNDGYTLYCHTVRPNKGLKPVY